MSRGVTKYNMDSFTEREAIDFAWEAARTVEIRFTKDGSSVDELVPSTDEERKYVAMAIQAALLAIREGYDVDACKNTAEWFLRSSSVFKKPSDREDEHLNSYGSVFCPICDFLNGLEVRV